MIGKGGEKPRVVQGAVEVDQEPAASPVKTRLGLIFEAPADRQGADIMASVCLEDMRSTGKEPGILLGNGSYSMFASKKSSHGRKSLLFRRESAKRR